MGTAGMAMLISILEIPRIPIHTLVVHPALAVHPALVVHRSLRRSAVNAGTVATAMRMNAVPGLRVSKWQFVPNMVRDIPVRTLMLA